MRTSLSISRGPGCVLSPRCSAQRLAERLGDFGWLNEGAGNCNAEVRLAELPLQCEKFVGRVPDLRNVDYGCDIPEAYAALLEASFLY
jgi:hypothetical protein